MLHWIEQAICAHTMLEGTEEVTVALSGGADSVALLHALLALRDAYGFMVYAAHMDHSLRGAESDADAQFVIDLCRAWQVPLFLEKVDVAALAAEQKQGIELAARNARYAFLHRVAKGRIATAHTADDNAETVLFHIARGAGLSGICGIPPVRGRVIRPLLYCTRAQVEAYCAEHHLSYRTDSTNADQHYARNRIRHSVLPQLRQINSGCVANIRRMSDILRADAAYLDSVAEQQYAALLTPQGLAVSELQKLHKAICTRVLLLHCKNKIGLSPGTDQVARICRLLENGTRTQISGAVYAVKSGGFLDFDILAGSSVLNQNLGDNFANLSFPGLKFIFQNGYSKKINNFVFKNSFDCAKIKGKLVIRHRLAGDLFRPVGRGGTKTLKKLFNESHLPHSVRSNCLILTDDLGIVWIQGFGVDERVRLTEQTERFVTVGLCTSI